MSSTNEGYYIDNIKRLEESDKLKFRNVNSEIFNKLQIMYNDLIPLLNIKKSEEYDIFEDEDIFYDDDNEKTIRYLTYKINYYEKIIKSYIDDLINEDIEKKKLYKIINDLENSIKENKVFLKKYINNEEFLKKNINNEELFQYKKVHVPSSSDPQTQIFRPIDYYIFYNSIKEEFKYNILFDYGKTQPEPDPKSFLEFKKSTKLNDIKETLNQYLVKLKSEEIVDILSAYDIKNFIKINIKGGDYIILIKNRVEEDTRGNMYSFPKFYYNKYILLKDKKLYKADIKTSKKKIGTIEEIEDIILTEVYNDRVKFEMFDNLYNSFVKNKYEIYKEESNPTKKLSFFSGFRQIFTKNDTGKGGNKKSSTYKLNGEKIALLHNNKKIQRSIYTKEKGKTKYCKINNEFILLSKLKNKIIK